MLQKGKAKKLSIYINESDVRHGTPLFRLLIELAHQRGLAGATVIRGIMGFGAGGHIHVVHPDLASKLPVRVEIIDSAAAIDAILPDVYDLVAEGLVVTSDLEVLKAKAPAAPAATPPAPAHLKLEGKAQMLRIFIEASDQWEGRPLYEALVARLRQLDIAGATVIRGELGAGQRGEVHRHKALAPHEPVTVIVVDAAEKIAEVQATLDEMIGTGMVVKSDVDVVFYRPKPTG
jgi:PII-like signaling protein